jgi:hypothetical protein
MKERESERRGSNVLSRFKGVVVIVVMIPLGQTLDTGWAFPYWS